MEFNSGFKGLNLPLVVYTKTHDIGTDRRWLI